jgi:hypothetical protein
MSNYNQEGQGKPDQKQQGNKLGAGQTPPPKPGQQNDLPDQSNLQQLKEKKNIRSEEKGLIHQLPGGEGG